MTTSNELHELLSHIGYQPRPQQEKLFELLSNVSRDGIIAQAGTGTGKSIAVLAAAVRAYRQTGIQSLIVTPTRILMDQYLAKDVPATRECFGLDIRELRGKRWYQCDMSADLTTSDEGPSGCLGRDVGCSLKGWLGHEDDPDFDWRSVNPATITPEYRCDYQSAKLHAAFAQIVVTNSDFWIINDRTLPDPVFAVDGAVFVDESHQLEAKLKDYAGRSIQAKELKKYYEIPGAKIAKTLEKYKDGKSEIIGPDTIAALQHAFEVGPVKNEQDKLPERAMEIQEAIGAMLPRLEQPTENCLIWSDGWGIKMDWIDISASARGLLTARPFGLVSATIPSSMPSALGVQDTAQVHDVGHPFDYSKQATIRISEADGSYRYANTRGNLMMRVNELKEEIEKTKGGCLLLFSAFSDMNKVYDELVGDLRRQGRLVLKQNDQITPRSNDELSNLFKENGNAVLFGSESFATGFDVPGDALELVSIWKLPYPGKDPVTDALAKRFFPRYRDLMLTRVVQGIGRLIRTETDRGRVFIADSRAESLLKSKDLMVRHLGEFARV